MALPCYVAKLQQCTKCTNNVRWKVSLKCGDINLSIYCKTWGSKWSTAHLHECFWVVSGDEPGSRLGTYFHIFILLYTSYISLSIFELVYHFHLAFFRLFQIFLIFLYLILVTFIPTLSSRSSGTHYYNKNTLHPTIPLHKAWRTRSHPQSTSAFRWLPSSHLVWIPTLTGLPAHHRSIAWSFGLLETVVDQKTVALLKSFVTTSSVLY